MGERTATALLSFIIDTTPPTIISVKDGNYTCGNSEWTVMVETDEKNISGYYFEVYDEGLIPSEAYKKIYGEQKSFGLGEDYEGYFSIYDTFSEINYSKFIDNKSKEIQPGIIFNNSVGLELPLKIPTSVAKEDHIYYTKVWTWDAVNNQALPKESDGIAVVNENSSFCVTIKENNIAPKIDFEVNDSNCLSNLVKLTCSSPVGCKEIKYGLSLSSSDCQANKTYVGQNLVIKGKQWLCYQASDYLGINISDNKLITFVDKDADGIKDKDSCDLCEKTTNGLITGEDGCAENQLTDEEAGKDQDQDGLPDAWETLRSREGCLLSPFSKDSNDDGVEDALEDYDDDGRSNLQEYYAGTDPCVEDEDFFSDDLYKNIDDEDGGTTGKYNGTAIDAKKKIDEGISTIKDDEGSLLALILILVGLLLIIGGTSYLIYYYKYSSESKKQDSVGGTRRITESEKVPSTPLTFKDKFFAWKKKENVERAKKKRRESLFGEFDKSSSQIPAVEKALRGSGSELSKIGNLAQHYSEHKEEIKPGLRKEEKNVFAKLDKIAGKTKDVPINKVVSKEEAKDIFGKLKDISGKRKKKK